MQYDLKTRYRISWYESVGHMRGVKYGLVVVSELCEGKNTRGDGMNGLIDIGK